MRTKTAIVKNIIIPFIDEVLGYTAIPPQVKGAWFACKVSYGLFTDLYPNEGKEFLEQVRKNAIEIGDILISSKDFQQSLALTFETLLRTRERRKRDLIKEVYLNGYIPAEDRYKMTLERFYRIGQEISLEALEYLKFIDETIIPLKENWAREEVTKMSKENRENDDEWWFRLNLQRKPDTEIIVQWIYEEFNPNSPKVKKRFPNIEKDKALTAKQFDEERKRLNLLAEISNELLSLGIFRNLVTGGLIGQGVGSSQTLSKFGQEFIKYVRLSSKLYEEVQENIL